MHITRKIAIPVIAGAALLSGTGIAYASTTGNPNPYPTPTVTPTNPVPTITPTPTPFRRCNVQFDRIQIFGLPFGTRFGQWDRVCVSRFGNVTVTPLTAPIRF